MRNIEDHGPRPWRRISNFHLQFLSAKLLLGIFSLELLVMEEILHQLIGNLSHDLHGFIHPRWCRISSINRINHFFHVINQCIDIPHRWSDKTERPFRDFSLATWKKVSLGQLHQQKNYTQLCGFLNMAISDVRVLFTTRRHQPPVVASNQQLFQVVVCSCTDGWIDCRGKIHSLKLN